MEELPEKAKTRKERPSVRALITDFCGYTSAVGPGRIHDGKYLIQKIIWSLLFIGAIVGFVIQITDLYKKFQQRPLSTNIKIIHDTSLDFPKITVCNFNPIRQSQLSRSEAVRDFFTEEYNEYNASGYGNYSSYHSAARKRKRREAADYPPADTKYDAALDTGEDYFDNEGGDDPNELDGEFAKEQKLSILLANEDENLLQTMGHTFEDLVYGCTFRGISCKNYTQYWTKFWHYHYGNCYVFNSKNSTKRLKTNKAGPTHGLVLTLNIEQNEYIGAITEEAGVKLDISQPGEMAFPLEKGFSIPSGFETSIGLRKVVIKRKDPFNNKRCVNASEMVDKGNLYRIRYGSSYSATACKESCLAYNQLSMCKCMEYRFPVDDDKIPPCDSLNMTTAKCLGMVQQRFKFNKLNCSTSCQPPCDETYFKASSSYAVWPSRTYEKYLIETDQIYASGDESYRSSVLKIKLFYEELNFETVEEERSYELVNFVSDFGGQLGLWIGFSVLTAAEFLELVVLILHCLLKKFLSSERESGSRENEHELNEINTLKSDSI